MAFVSYEIPPEFKDEERWFNEIFKGLSRHRSDWFNNF